MSKSMKIIKKNLSDQVKEPTEKKRRVVKPVILPETKELIDKGWLEFLSLNPDKAKDEDIIRLAAPLIPGSYPKGVYEKKLLGHVKHLRETLMNLKNAVSISLGREDGDLRDWLNKAVKAFGMHFSTWDQNTSLFLPSTIKKNLKHYEHIRASGAALVGMAFRRTKTDPSGNAAFFIGLCQCGKIFKKDNPKKSWCSDACRWAFGKRRERNRQQSSA